MNLEPLIPYAVKDRTDFIRYLFVRKENKDLKLKIKLLEQDVENIKKSKTELYKEINDYKQLLTIKKPQLSKVADIKKRLRFLEYVTLRNYKNTIERLEEENINLKIKLNES